MVAVACRCGGNVLGGVCDRCGPKRTKRFTDRPHNRRDWYDFSHRFLAAHPLCQDCEQQGTVTPATETHHIVKVRDDARRMFDHENCMALCHACHSIRTARGE